MRVHGIDVFRGLSIILMVIFTMIQVFSGSLPDLLVHNRPASIHIGDFVLPMFLFASGMSLVFFRRKRMGTGRLDYALDVLERAGKLSIIWIFLSPFTSGELFGMDEIMLNVLLFMASSVDVYCAKKEQVSKHATGGYIPAGAFAITGQRTWFRGVKLALRIGKTEKGIEVVPDRSKKHMEKELVLVPSKAGKEKGKLAKSLAKRFGVHPDELLMVLPSGKTKTKEA